VKTMNFIARYFDLGAQACDKMNSACFSGPKVS